jgi:hypothetical protein
VKKEDLISLVKWNVYIIVTDVVVLFFFSLVSGLSISEAAGLRQFPTLLFIESAVVFLIGSSFELSASIFFSKVREYVFHSGEKWAVEDYETGRKKASPYLVLGFVLLVEAFISSFLLG